MSDLFLSLTKLAGLATAAEFIVAMRLYFRMNDDQSRRNRLWSALAITTVAVHVYILAVTISVPHVMLAAAMLCFLAANVLFWSAVASHSDQRPSVVFGATVPNKLVTHGPYSIVRHPFYLAYSVDFLGSCFAGCHWLQVATTVTLFFGYNYAASVEENLLLSESSAVKDDYRDYVKNTWRWLPLIW